MTFETAAEHATPRVPAAGPLQRVGDLRQRLVRQRYESATHIVVCEADTFLGMVTIEDLLFAAADTQIETLMDRGAPWSRPVSTKRSPRGGPFAMANLQWLSLMDRAISWE